MCIRDSAPVFGCLENVNFLNRNFFAESDNFGSTDSEVKKILTLHLPISEYDTLGSDSEADGRQTTNQELVSFRHIGPPRGEFFEQKILATK